MCLIKEAYISHQACCAVSATHSSGSSVIIGKLRQFAALVHSVLFGVESATSAMERMSDVVEISSETLDETNVSDPVSLAKEKNMSTVFEVVEISPETLEV